MNVLWLRKPQVKRWVHRKENKTLSQTESTYDGTLRGGGEFLWESTRTEETAAYWPQCAVRRETETAPVAESYHENRDDGRADARRRLPLHGPKLQRHSRILPRVPQLRREGGCEEQIGISRIIRLWVWVSTTTTVQDNWDADGGAAGSGSCDGPWAPHSQHQSGRAAARQWRGGRGQRHPVMIMLRWTTWQPRCAECNPGETRIHG